MFKVCITQITGKTVFGKSLLVEDFQTLAKAEKAAKENTHIYTYPWYEIREYDDALPNTISFDEQDTGRIVRLVCDISDIDNIPANILEKCYRVQKRRYQIEDAKAHAEHLDVLHLINGNDWDRLVDIFEKVEDCNIPENQLWENVIEIFVEKKNTKSDIPLKMRLLNAGYPKEDMFHHASDLYVFVTPTTTKVVTEWAHEHGYNVNWHCPTFKDQITGRLMYDCAFQWYEEKEVS